MTDLSIEAALLWSNKTLKDLTETAVIDSQILLGFCLQQSRTYLLTWPEKTLSEQQVKNFRTIVERRFKGEPIAYILGEREFWSLNLRVTTDTLIPRAETELLVEIALEKIQHPDSKTPTKTIADLGTGSGAIALAMAHECSHCQIVATDLSLAALEVAQYNAKNLELKNIEFYQGSWGEPLKGKKFNLILSNPPYVEKHDPHLKQGDLRFEPMAALAAEDEGFADLKTISHFAANALDDEGWLLMEHGYNQSQRVREILSQNGFIDVQSWQDLGGIERVTGGRRGGEQ